MIPDQRHLFGLSEGVACLDCASRSPLLETAKAAGEAGIGRKLQPWTYDPARGPAEAEELRALFAALVGAEAGDIAIVPAASYGIKTAALNLPVEAGQRILIPEQPFPSHFYAWRELAAETGAAVEIVPEPGDGDWTAAVLERLRPEIAIAALPACRGSMARRSIARPWARAAARPGPRWCWTRPRWSAPCRWTSAASSPIF